MERYYDLRKSDFIPLVGLFRYLDRNNRGLDYSHDPVDIRGTALLYYNCFVCLGGPIIAGMAVEGLEKLLK